MEQQIKINIQHPLLQTQIYRQIQPIFQASKQVDLSSIIWASEEMWTFKNNLVITIRYRVRHRTQWKCFIKLWNKMNTNKPKSKRTTGKCSTPKSHNKNCKNTSNSNSSHNLRDSLDDSNQTIKLKLRQGIVIIMKICQINMIQMEEIDKGIKRIKKIQKINSKMADIYKHFCKKKIKIKVLNLNRNKICKINKPITGWNKTLKEIKKLKLKIKFKIGIQIIIIKIKILRKNINSVSKKIKIKIKTW